MDKRADIMGCATAYSVVNPEGAHTVAVLHGWGCERATVAAITDAAAATGARVITVDLPGHGASAEPPEVWGVEQYTRHIEALLQQEGVDDARLTLVGHSFGGRISILYASRHPQVQRVVLVDAAGVKPRRSLRYYCRVYAFKAAKLWWRLVLGKERAEERIQRERERRGSDDYRRATPRMRAILSRTVNEDLCAVMPQIQAPTLLIWGENDTATPLADARKMERLIPGAALVSFPGCGHYSFLDNPRQFRATLISFLNS